MSARLPVPGVWQQRGDGLVNRTRVVHQQAARFVAARALVTCLLVGLYAAPHAAALAQGLQVHQRVEVPVINAAAHDQGVPRVAGQGFMHTFGHLQPLGAPELTAVVSHGDEGADHRANGTAQGACPPYVSGKAGQADKCDEAAHASIVVLWMVFGVNFLISLAMSQLISAWLMRRFRRDMAALHATNPRDRA